MIMTPLEALFEHLYYGMTDVAYLVLYIIALYIVKNTRWQAHARWIKPWILAAILSVIYRTISNTHYFFRFPLPDSLYILDQLCLYVGNALELYGVVILIKTLRRMVDGTLPEAAPETPHAPFDHGTWPPPPTAPR